MRRESWIILGLILLTALAYHGVLRCGLIALDDDHYVANNRYVQQGLTPAAVRWAWVGFHEANWHPLTWLSLMLDRQIFGPRLWGYHLTNLALHAANVTLLFGLLRMATGSVGRSALAAALWGIHPLRVESVAWVAERKDVLSLFFGLLALLAYVRYARTLSWRWYALVGLGLLLSLLAKPMLVTLPALLLLLDYWPLHRWDAGAGRRWPWRRLAVEKIPLLLLVVVFSFVVLQAQHAGGAVRDWEQVSLESRLANAAVSYVRYLQKLVWFRDLAVLYPYPRQWPVGLVAGALLFLAAVSTAACVRARRNPFLLVGWLWYLLALVPMIGLVQVGTQALADRYSYLPAIGLAFLVAWALPGWLADTPSRRLLTAGLSVLVLGILAVGTHIQVGYWRDSGTLFEHTLVVTEGNYLIHNNLGTVLEQQGQTAAALAHYRAALRINPFYANALNNYGAEVAQQGLREEAIRCYLLALRCKPNYAQAYNNLGVALEERGQIAQAVANYRQAIAADPDYAAPHNNLAICLVKQKRPAEARAHYEAALALQPDYADAHANLADLLVATGNPAPALAHYRLALQYNPRLTKLHAPMAELLTALNDYREAESYLRAALRDDPQNAHLHFLLGLTLVNLGHLPEAVACYQAALQISPNDARMHNNLGAALARLGRLDEALGQFQTAVRLQPEYEDAQDNLRRAQEMKAGK